VSDQDHAATRAILTAMRHAHTLEQAAIGAEEFAEIDNYVNVVVMVIAAFEQPSDFRERPYAYIVLDDGAGPRVVITGDNSVPQILRYMSEERLPAKLWLRHYECDNGGFRRYWNKASRSAVPGQVVDVSKRGRSD
jgi:hypothetical protein